MAESDSYIWKSLFPESPHQRPCHRSKQAACRIQGQVYMYGGRDGHKTLRDFWRYDIPTNIWTRMECGGDTPPPLQEHTMIAHEGCLFIFGGELGYGSCGETPLWIYNIARQTWEKPVIDSEVMTPTGRRGHTVVAWQGGMHVYGGYIDLKGSSSELWTLDFETKWWHLSVGAQLDNSPAPRHWHSAVVYQSNMWIYGGLNNLVPLRDLWRWNFDSRQWTRVKGRQSPSSLHGHSAVCVVDSMMIFGGEDNEGEYGNDLWKFHFASCTWQCTTPTRRVIPTSCTRHVLLSIPSNQIVDDTYLSPTAGDLRPQSAPTQVHRGRNIEAGGALTRPNHLADMFVLRPRSSPPVVGNERRQEDRRVHHFTNRVHPSPDEEPDPRRTLFGSKDEDLEGEDETIYTAAEDEGVEASNGRGHGGKTLNGMWAVPVSTKDAAASPQRDRDRTWAMTATVAPVDDSQVEEEETSELLVNEASPVHHCYVDAGWKCQEVIATSPSHPLPSNGDCILEDVISDPSFPPPFVQANGDITLSAAQNVDVERSIPTPTYELDNFKMADRECNNLEEADDLIYPLPKRTSNPDSTSLTWMNKNSDTLDGIYRTFTSDDSDQGSALQTSELPELQEPEESNVDERTSPSLLGRGNVICVKPLDSKISESNVDIMKCETDRQKLLPSTNKQIATFVNYGFMSSRESLLYDETSEDVDFKTHQSDPPRIILNGSTDQSSDGLVPVNQSHVTLHTQSRHGHQSGMNYANGTIDQSEGTYHQSSRQMLYKRKLLAAQSKQASHQRIIHVKPTNHRVCQISVEEMNKPNSQTNTSTEHSEPEQKPATSSEDSSKIKSRPRHHGRSQTLNSLPDRKQTFQGRPKRLTGQEEDAGQNNGFGEEDEDEWEWPVFLYLMGGEETGSSSLHRNNSPMSVWKCCIVRGKQSETEVQRILARY